MKKTILTLVLAISSLAIFAQQDAMFTHYMFNTLSVNSGYAGSRDALTITGLNRSQWVGFDGAPTTQTLTLHSPIYNENLGVGLSLVNDKIGPTNNTSIYGDFAYKVKLNEKGKLAFGLKAGLSIRKTGLSDLSLNTQNDQAFISDQESLLLPNFGFGMYYSEERYYVGLSIPKLLKNDFSTNESFGGTNLASEERHYFLIAGAVFDINKDFKIKPTTLIKLTMGAPIEVDLTALLLYKDKVWAGAMYRSNDAIGLLVGMHINDQLAIGYSYDWSYGNKTFRYNGGSHELMLMYDLIYKDKSKIRSPRYF